MVSSFKSASIFPGPILSCLISGDARSIPQSQGARVDPQELGVGVVARISVAGRGASYPGGGSKNARPRRAPAAATPRKGRRPGFSSPSILVPPAVWPEEGAVTLLFRNCKVPL